MRIFLFGFEFSVDSLIRMSPSFNCLLMGMFKLKFLKLCANKIEMNLAFSYKIIFVKTISNVFLILIILIIFELIWIIGYFIGKKSNLKMKIISTFVIIMETYNSGVLVQITNSIVCKQIGEKYFLSKDLLINCEDKYYLDWVKINLKKVNTPGKYKIKTI